MRFVLDTNEYIGAVGLVKNPPSEELLVSLAESFPQHSVHLPRIIISESRRNLPAIVFASLVKLIQKFAIIDEDIIVPFELGAKYEAKGLKAADAFIAAYAEWVGADALVTENRHFLSRRNDLPFKVVTAEACLKLIKK